MSNEVLIAPELLEQFLAQGGSRLLSVQNGPAPEAKIVNSYWRFDGSHPIVVLVYDREVPMPTMTHEHDLERRIGELEAENRRLTAALHEEIQHEVDGERPRPSVQFHAELTTSWIDGRDQLFGVNLRAPGWLATMFVRPDLDPSQDAERLLQFIQELALRQTGQPYAMDVILKL